MGKALLIKNVNFSEVAVDQVSVSEMIPCTAISLNPSTLTFDTHEESKQVVASLTPSNTTDELEWGSSNENVATVVDGLVTIHGIGTATITATCGNITESITISQTSLKQQRTVYTEANRSVEKLSADYPIIRTISANNNSVIAQTLNSEDTDLLIQNTAVFELIKVPYGATKAKIATTDSSSFTIYRTVIADTTQKITYNSVEYSVWDRNDDNGNTATGIDVVYGEALAFRLSGTSNIDKVSYVYFE